MTPGPLLMDYLRDWLIAQNVVRKPSVAGSLPPLYLSPDAIPAPGDGQAPNRSDNIVIAATWAPETPSARHEGFMSMDSVAFWLRTRTTPQAIETHHMLRGLLHDQRHYDMAGLVVQESLLEQGLAFTGGPAQALTHKCQYRFAYFVVDAAA